jgi:CBS domain-containing protein
MTEVPWDDDSTAYPVVDGSRPVGILPARRLADTPMDEWTTVRIRDRMVPLHRLQLLKPDDPALDAMLALARAGADSALVLEDGRLAGIVYARDVADALELGRHRPWRRGRRDSASGSAVVPLHPRPVAVPRHHTGPPRDAA